MRNPVEYGLIDPTPDPSGAPFRSGGEYAAPPPLGGYPLAGVLAKGVGWGISYLSLIYETL